MTQIKDGGPAFPLQSIGPDFAPGYAGMTLRDYFAAKAMQGELSASVCTDDKSDYGIPLNVSDEKLDRMTKHWFRIADSMLKARGTQ